MARSQLPYNANTLTFGAYQVWHYEPQEFLQNNAVDLGDFIAPNILPLTAPTLPMTLYQTIDGKIIISAILAYTGPPVSTSIQLLVNLEEFTEIFKNKNVPVEAIQPMTIFRASGDVDTNSFSALLNTSTTPFAVVEIDALFNSISGAALQTNDQFFLNMVFNPFPSFASRT